MEIPCTQKPKKWFFAKNYNYPQLENQPNKIVLVAAMTFRGAVSCAHCGQYLVSNIIAIRIDNEKIWAFTHYACYKAIIGTAKVSYDRISYQRGIKDSEFARIIQHDHPFFHNPNSDSVISVGGSDTNNKRPNPHLAHLLCQLEFNYLKLKSTEAKTCKKLRVHIKNEIRGLNKEIQSIHIIESEKCEHFKKTIAQWDMYKSQGARRCTKEVKQECCINCMRSFIELAFIPCGHACLCSNCYSTYACVHGFICPVCKGPIDNPLLINRTWVNEQGVMVEYKGNKCQYCNNNGDQLYLLDACRHSLCGQCLGYSHCKVCKTASNIIYCIYYCSQSE